MAKAIYIRPEVEILKFPCIISLLSEASLTDFGVDEFEQASGQDYYDITEGT